MAMNNKNTPSGKSLKMSADDLKEMVKAAVAECLGEEKEDTPPAEETAGEGMDVMSVIEEAVEAAAEKRKARKEAGEEVPEEITPDEIIAEAAAILDGLTAEEEAKADDAETEEKSEEEVAEGKATKTTTARPRSAPQPPRSASTRTSICPARPSPSRRRKSPPTCSSPAL